MKLKIVNQSDYPLPNYATPYSAGLDIRVVINDNNKEILPKQKLIYNTKLFIEIPKNYYGMIVSRSGLSCKSGVAVINSPGIIDSDYRGELLITLINHGDSIYYVNNGERVAQLIIMKYERIELTTTKKYNLNKTKRLDGHYGSTGIL
ncbi:MAG: dUTP diphosphatase [Bacteroidales bacterium OttesenSCG-928-I14]|jgi:dUTP pyrophosphatase|nr:dUTP diphosphatase [Bacteroidales bacterium OttesenSCG-928-I14]